MVPEPDQLPANGPNEPALWALPSAIANDKIVKAKAAPQNAPRKGFGCDDIGEVLTGHID